MSRWSDSWRTLSQEARGQVEPLAALVAVFAVGAALTTYAGLVDATLPTPDRNLAEPTVERAERAISEHGVVEQTTLSDGLHAGPDGYRANLTLTVAEQEWHVGPTPPDADAADRSDVRVSVRVAPGKIRPGRLRAEVWR
jgi:hypothetical protein